MPLRPFGTPQVVLHALCFPPHATRRLLVVFDREAPHSLLAFGLTVFIEPEYADTLARNPEPFIARELLRLWLAGCAPFLNERTMGRANASSGVDVLVLHQGFAAGYGPETMTGLRLQLGQSFTGAHAGLRFRSFTHELYPEGPVTESEVFGYPSPRAAAAAGFLIRPYARPASTGPLENLPFVIGMTREEARERPGNLITDIMFAWDGRPYYGLDSASRRVLKLALDGETDEAIAHELDVSIAAVKKAMALDLRAHRGYRAQCFSFLGSTSGWPPRFGAAPHCIHMTRTHVPAGAGEEKALLRERDLRRAATLPPGREVAQKSPGCGPRLFSNAVSGVT